MDPRRREMTVRVVALDSPEASQPPSPSGAAERVRLVSALSAQWRLATHQGGVVREDAPNQDFRDIVAELVRADARFLIVGAHALGLHGVPRATADLDLWIDNSPDNVERVWRALAAFGAPLSALGLQPSDLLVPDSIAQFGVPPYRIDLMTGVSGLSFAEAWQDHVEEMFYDVRAPFISRDAFIRNKRASGRLKDRADLEALGER